MMNIFILALVKSNLNNPVDLKKLFEELLQIQNKGLALPQRLVEHSKLIY
jgi:hypothetical protein